MSRSIPIAVIHQTEAWEGCPLFAYDDAVYPTRPAVAGERIRGTLTAGAGHTGPDVYIGQRITQAQADAWLADDLQKSVTATDAMITVDLPDHQFFAVNDAVFNAGAGAIGRSTLVKDINAGRLDEVPAQFALWIYTTVDGKKIKSNGLVARRAHEIAMWNNPTMIDVVVPGVPGATAVGTKAPPVTAGQAVGGGAVVAAGGAIAAGVHPLYVVAAVVVAAAIAFVVISIIRNRK